MVVFLSYLHLMARCHKQRSIFFLLDRFIFSLKLLCRAVFAVLDILTFPLPLGWCAFTCMLLKQS